MTTVASKGGTGRRDKLWEVYQLPAYELKVSLKGGRDKREITTS